MRAAGTIIESQRWVDAVIGMLEGRGAPDVIAELRGRFALATPADALRAADSLHAMRADFAKIRNGDPLADIRATRRVHAVVARGKLYDRRALDVLLSVAR